MSISSSIVMADMDIRGERTSFFERNKPKPLGFNYSFLEPTYFITTVESANYDLSVSVLGVDLTFDLTLHYAVSLKATGGTYNFDNTAADETIETHFGFFRHQPFSKSTDSYVGLTSVNIALADQSTSTVSASGFSLFAGIRQRINPEMEWGVSVATNHIEDITFTAVKIEYAYGSDNETQYIIGYESSDKDESTSSFSASIRLNF